MGTSNAYTFFKCTSFQNSMHTTCTHTHSYTHARTCMHTHTHACTHVHTCMHTHMHTHTHTQSYIRTYQKRFFKRGFQGRFERTDRNRMTDRNTKQGAGTRDTVSNLTFWRLLTLLLYTGLLWCFLNPPNPNMDCRIFNVLTWHFCMRMPYTRDLSLLSHPKDFRGVCRQFDSGGISGWVQSLARNGHPSISGPRSVGLKFRRVCTDFGLRRDLRADANT